MRRYTLTQGNDSITVEAAGHLEAKCVAWELTGKDRWVIVHVEDIDRWMTPTPAPLAETQRAFEETSDQFATVVANLTAYITGVPA